MGKDIYEFSDEKNKLLINERGISFEEIISAIDEGSLLDVIPHPNPSKYPNQKIYVVNINDYVCLVPFVRKSRNRVFLKTIFFNRKLNKLYLEGDIYEKNET